MEGVPGSQELVVEVRAAEPFDEPDMMVEIAPPFSLGRPKVDLQDDARFARLRLPVFAGRGKADLRAANLTLTLVDGDRASEHQVAIEP